MVGGLPLFAKSFGGEEARGGGEEGVHVAILCWLKKISSSSRNNQLRMEGHKDNEALPSPTNCLLSEMD